MSVRLPIPLFKGATVGLICPAGGVDDYSQVKLAGRYLKKYGYNVKYGSSLTHNRKVYKYLSGDDKARLADIHDFWFDKEVDAIFCLKGGYGSLRLLDKLDFVSMKKKKKIIIGFSDITILLLALYSKLNLMTFHGPMLGAEFLKRNLMPTDKDSAKHMFNILKDPLFRFSYNAKKDGIVIQGGKAKGTLIAGNLTSICSMIGTNYLPDFKRSILLLEDCNEHPYTVDRMLTQLINGGYLKGVSGLIFSSFYNSGFTSRRHVSRFLREVVQDYSIPIIYYFPCGHGAKNYTLPIGRKVVLNADKLTLKSVD